MPCHFCSFSFCLVSNDPFGLQLVMVCESRHQLVLDANKRQHHCFYHYTYYHYHYYYYFYYIVPRTTRCILFTTSLRRTSHWLSLSTSNYRIPSFFFDFVSVGNGVLGSLPKRRPIQLRVGKMAFMLHRWWHQLNSATTTKTSESFELPTWKLFS